jgi:hypothetical protein
LLPSLPFCLIDGAVAGCWLLVAGAEEAVTRERALPATSNFQPATFASFLLSSPPEQAIIICIGYPRQTGIR